MGEEQSCADRPAGAEVMLKSSLTVSVVREVPKDARLHTRSCTYTEKCIRNGLHSETAVRQLFTSFLACEHSRMNAPSVGMLPSTHPSASQGN